jgi:hypothetical protein
MSTSRETDPNSILRRNEGETRPRYWTAPARAYLATNATSSIQTSNVVPFATWNWQAYTAAASSFATGCPHPSCARSANLITYSAQSEVRLTLLPKWSLHFAAGEHVPPAGSVSFVETLTRTAPVEPSPSRPRRRRDR